MTIFHEIYGAYYRITARLLRRGRMTRQDITDAIAQDGFRDSMLFLPQKLIPQPDGSDWGLLHETADGTFEPVTKHLPEHPLTLLQRRWLRAKLADPKIRLFLTDEQYDALEAALAETPPLFRPDQFRCPDQFADGDCMTDPKYRAVFRIALHALRNGTAILLAYRTAHGAVQRHCCLPVAMEYSQKNDKFRLYCRRIRRGKLTGSTVFNLGRIISIRMLRETPENAQTRARFFESLRCAEPVTVRVTDERSGLARFLMEFAAYEKHTERDTETGSCTVQIWYNRSDETELLIQLLSFGPVLEILSPPDFRQKAAERVAAQYALLFPE
ncbi:MAG: WYL domain-containing protein [Oscillospiraceae bacterium]|nr:WYL domain-containing protein [Oscillospiraceae bacterium]